MKYDNVTWHSGGNYPEDLPPDNAATHIGMFLEWCLCNGLASDELAEDSGEDIAEVCNGNMTGAEFLLNNCDGKFWDDDLSETGQAFAGDYYNNDSDFAEYTEDYGKVVAETERKNGVEYPSLYHFENSPENRRAVAEVISKRFQEWGKLNMDKQNRKV